MRKLHRDIEYHQENVWLNDNNKPLFPALKIVNHEQYTELNKAYNTYYNEGYRDYDLRFKIILELQYFHVENKAYNNRFYNTLFINISRTDTIRMLNAGQTAEFLKLFREPLLYVKNKIMKEILINNAYLEYYGIWGMLPDYESLMKIKEFINDQFTLDVGAGSGLYSLLLKSVGINIMATDPRKETYHTEYMKTEEYDSLQAIEKYNNAQVLFISWPRGWPTTEDMQLFKGRKVIIIGERCESANFGVFDCDYTTGEYIMPVGWQLTDTLFDFSYSYLHEGIYLFQRVNDLIYTKHIKWS